MELIAIIKRIPGFYQSGALRSTPFRTNRIPLGDGYYALSMFVLMQLLLYPSFKAKGLRAVGDFNSSKEEARISTCEMVPNQP